MMNRSAYLWFAHGEEEAVSLGKGAVVSVLSYLYHQHEVIPAASKCHHILVVMAAHLLLQQPDGNS